jgi:hypothetical protein
MMLQLLRALAPLMHFPMRAVTPRVHKFPRLISRLPSIIAQQQVGETSEQIIERRRQLKNELARNRYVPRSDRGFLRPLEELASTQRQRLQHRNEAARARYVSRARLHLPDKDIDADSPEAYRLRRNASDRLRYAAVASVATPVRAPAVTSAAAGGPQAKKPRTTPLKP